jgi:hypothetical protein
VDISGLACIHVHDRCLVRGCRVHGCRVRGCLARGYLVRDCCRVRGYCLTGTPGYDRHPSRSPEALVDPSCIRIP